MSHIHRTYKNKLKEVLAQNLKTNRWLAEQIGRSRGTISRWCSNKTQPSLAQLKIIARMLNVEVEDLIIRQDVQESERGEEREETAV